MRIGGPGKEYGGLSSQRPPRGDGDCDGSGGAATPTSPYRDMCCLWYAYSVLHFAVLLALTRARNRSVGDRSPYL